jgi:hypothetical protein
MRLADIHASFFARHYGAIEAIRHEARSMVFSFYEGMTTGDSGAIGRTEHAEKKAEQR